MLDPALLSRGVAMIGAGPRLPALLVAGLSLLSAPASGASLGVPRGETVLVVSRNVR
jgi:hypothetical protein